MEKTLALLHDDLARVEARFKQDLESEIPLIRKVGEYVLSSGGKRIRPILLLLAARLAGYRGEQHIALASVVEFIHTATLLHDDVVDAAVLRRGNASANAVWGNQASVLVGDFLFARSFFVMVKAGNLRILEILSDATTQMAEGEMLQLISTSDVSLEEERYMTVIRTKTAVLIAAACRCGGLLGTITDEQDQALNTFGMELGVAFQLMDDALDYDADPAAFGKARCQDLREGKITLPLIQTLRCCTPTERDEIAALVESDDPDDLAIQRIVTLIDRYRGVAYTRQRAAALVASTKERLRVFPENEARLALEELADFVVARRH